MSSSIDKINKAFYDLPVNVDFEDEEATEDFFEILEEETDSKNQDRLEKIEEMENEELSKIRKTTTLKDVTKGKLFFEIMGDVGIRKINKAFYDLPVDIDFEDEEATEDFFEFVSNIQDEVDEETKQRIERITEFDSSFISEIRETTILEDVKDGRLFFETTEFLERLRQQQIRDEDEEEKKRVQEIIDRNVGGVEGLENEQDLLKFTVNNKFETEPIPFAGYSWASHMLIIYLLKKHKNDCVIWGEEFGSMFDIIRDVLLFEPPISGNRFMPDEEKHKKFLKKIKKCSEKGFMVLIPLSIKLDAFKPNRHANMIIYDGKNKVLEHFEPDQTFDSITLAHELKKFFRKYKILPKHKYHYFKKLCPNIPLQDIEKRFIKQEKKENGFVIADPPGFCVAWSFFYADLRLTFPDSTPDQVLSMVSVILKSKPKLFRQFIRGFSLNYMKIFRELKKELNKAGITEKTFERFESDFSLVQQLNEFFNWEIVRFGKMSDEKLENM
jgi:hypothetical protein